MIFVTEVDLGILDFHAEWTYGLTTFGCKMRVSIWKTAVYSVNKHIINQVS